jgi:hypothetical protein
VRISSKLSENPLPVGFVLERKTYSYGMRGPLTQSFVQQIVYNEGTDKQVTSQVTLDFMQGDNAGGGQPQKTQFGQFAPDDSLCGAKDDMSFWASVSAEFRLGMKGGEDTSRCAPRSPGSRSRCRPASCSSASRRPGAQLQAHGHAQDSLLDLEPAMDGAYVFMAGFRPAASDRTCCHSRPIC